MRQASVQSSLPHSAYSGLPKDVGGLERGVANNKALCAAYTAKGDSQWANYHNRRAKACDEKLLRLSYGEDAA